MHDYIHDGALVPPPARATVVRQLRHWARLQPEHPYLTWCPKDGEPTVLTYGELERRSRDLAAVLRKESAGDAVVALLPGNDIPSVVAVFAALRAGTPCLFVSPHDPEQRIRSVLRPHSIGAFWRSPFVGEQVADFFRIIPDVLSDSGALPHEEELLPASHPAFLFGTSGSTAESKTVVQEHRALIANAEAVRRHHRLGPGTTVMGGLPIHHVNGVHFTLIAVMYAGAHVVLPQEISAFSYRRLIEEHRPHIASVVPSVLETLLATGRGWQPPDTLRYFVSAAAPLTTSLIQRAVKALNVRVIQGYGLTETTNFSTTVPVDVPEQTYCEVALEAGIPSVGVPLHGNEVEILAADGTVLGERQTGEICMRGHNVMAGYAHRPDLTADAFAQGWFHSGDLGYWAVGPDGRRYFYITGRSKNVAKIRGEAVSLEEVERALLSIGAVIDAGCVALPHPTQGEQLVALVATRAERLVDIRGELATLVPPHAVPSRWLRRDTIPRTTTGKLQRPQLAELACAETSS
ncbi:class I adenylate-forming enzyme family protein [Streptomyces rochei]|uniref:class I adenylate-forming enzyme family protein n=1 Tax=Streptomyces rochei TaxID=1928 RepID=UPI0036875BAC